MLQLNERASCVLTIISLFVFLWKTFLQIVLFIRCKHLEKDLFEKSLIFWRNLIKVLMNLFDKERSMP